MLKTPIEWKAFSLEHVNLPDDGDPDELWATAAERVGLLPLAAFTWARAREDDSLRKVQQAIFEARHVGREKVGSPDVLERVLSSAGVDGPAVVSELTSDRRWLDEARADHEEAVSLGIFGVPTLLFPGCGAMFVRLTAIPEGDDVARVFERVRQACADPLVDELKRPKPK
ncbi:MAG TPA: DsbA family protein [Actinomycetota bacterium]|nr:DsbA family protein [Actinomycetota bacterium]